jgi:hypothetical protein
LKKCHDLGYLSFSLNSANQINMSKLYKKLPNIATKFSDHLSIISVGNVQRFLYFWIKWPLKGANQFHMSKLDKSIPKNATDKVW